MARKALARAGVVEAGDDEARQDFVDRYVACNPVRTRVWGSSDSYYILGGCCSFEGRPRSTGEAMAMVLDVSYESR